MKYSFLLLTLVFSNLFAPSQSILAQTPTPWVISSQGKSHLLPTLQLDWILGEPVSETAVGHGFVFTQGFLQPSENTLTIQIQSNQPVCRGGTLSLSADSIAGATYIWQGPNGFTGNQAWVSRTAFQPADTGLYVVQVSHPTLGQDRDTIAISLGPVPFQLTLSPTSPVNLCPGDSMVLTATGATSYLWSNGSTASSIRVSSAGSWSVTGQDGNGCISAPQLVQVNLRSRPVVALQPAGTITLCSGDSLLVRASGAASYLWSQGGTADSSRINAAGTYSVVGQDAFGCSSLPASVTVIGLSSPVLSIQPGGPTSICQGDSISLTASGGQSYSWNTQQTGSQIFVRQSGTYQVNGTSLNGCAGTSAPITITVRPLPSVSIQLQGPGVICQGGTVVLSAQGASSYLWNNSMTGQSISTTSSGAFSVTGTDSLGCRAVSQPLAVTVNPLPIVSVIPLGSLSFCPGGSVQLIATGASSYVWSNNSTNPVIQVSSGGTYRVTGYDQNGCSVQTSPLSVTVHPTPIIQVNSSGPLQFCQGGQVMLTATGGVSYQWNTGGTSASLLVQQSGVYQVTGTDANGCSVTAAPDTVRVLNPTLRIEASGPLTFCQGSSVFLYARGGSNYLWSSGQTQQTLPIISSGTYTLTGTDSAGCGTGSATVQVRVNPLPTVGLLSSGPIRFCPGDSVQFIGTGAQIYIWSTGQVGPVITARTAGTYRVSGIDQNGCVATSPDSIVTLNPAPVLTLTTSGPMRFCQGNQVTLSASGGSSYLWSTGQTTSSISVNSSGTYFVTGSNPFGCSSRSVDTIVTVDPLPVVQIIPQSNPMFCAGDSVILAASGATQYLWSNGATTPSITVLQSGTFTVTGTDVLGCSAISAAQTVVAKPLPIITIGATGPLTFCQGGSVTLYGQGGSSYQWSTGHQGDSLLVSSSGTYNVTGFSPSGCQATAAFVQVTVLPIPQVSISPAGTITICQGDSVILRASGASLYTWSNSQTGDSIVVRSSGIFSVIGFDANACSNTSPMVRVIVVNLPTVSIQNNGPLNFCQGDSVILSVSGTHQYLWSNGATTQSITATQNGSYTVTATNTFGCSRTSSPAIVQVHPLPVVNITAGGPLRFCQGGNVLLTATGASSYTWSNGNQTPSIQPSTTGSYQVLGISALGGCQNLSSVVQVQVDTLPIVQTTPTGSQLICTGNSLTLVASGANTYLWSTGGTGNSISVSGIGTYQVTGTDGNGCTSASLPVNLNNFSATVNILASGPLSFCAGGQVVLSTSTSGNYLWSNGQTGNSIQVSQAGTYSVSGTDNNGCQVNSASVSITIHPLPILTITPGGPTTFCQGGQVMLTASGGASYTWSTGQTGSQIVANQAGNYRVTGISPLGCIDSSSLQTIQVLPVPAIPQISGTQTISRGQTVTLTASGSQGNYQWWTAGVGGSNLGSGAIYTSGPINTFTYFYADATLNGCTSARDSFLIVFPEAILTNSPVCSGSAIYFDVSPLLPMGNVLWTGPNGFSSTVRNPGISQSTIASGGVYSIQITQGTQVVFTDTVRVVVGQNMSNTIVMGNSPACNLSTLNLSVPSYPQTTYLWGGPLGFSSLQAQTSITGITGAQGGQYSITANSPGCPTWIGLYNVSVIGGQPLNATINTPVCAGSGMFLVAQDPGGGINPLWQGPGGYQSGFYSTSRINAIPSMSGIYTFTVSIPGCGIQSATVSAVVQAAPSAIQSGVTSPVCAGNTLTLSAVNTPGIQYLWQGPSGFSANTAHFQIPNVAQGQAGRYTLTLNSPGCSPVTRTHDVLVNGWGTVAPGSNSPVCSGGVLNLSAQNPGGATLFSWAGPNNYFSSTQYPSIAQVTNMRAGTYTLTVTIPACPTRVDSTVVVVNSAISNASGWSNSPVCQGNVLRLSATYYPNATYSWQGPSGFTSNVFNPMINNAQPNQSGQYTVTLGNPGCGGRIITIPVQINPQPQALGGSNSPVCQGNILNLTAPIYSGASYAWRQPNGTITTTSNVSIIQAHPTASGIYTLTITSPGCSTINQNVAVSVTGSVTGITVSANANPICANSTLILTGSQPSGSTYTWTGPNGYSANGAMVTIPNIPVTAGGIYTYLVNSPGCGINTRTLNITVNSTAGISAGLIHNPVCQGNPVYLLGIGPANVAYSWQGPAGFVSSIQNPSINVIQLFQAGNYTVRASAPGCPQTTATVQLIVNTCREINPNLQNTEADLYSDGFINQDYEEVDLKMNIYPNPAKAITLVELIGRMDEESTIRVFDALGHEVLVGGKILSHNKWELNLSEVARGIYWIEWTGASKRLREKIILE